MWRATQKAGSPDTWWSQGECGTCGSRGCDRDKKLVQLIERLDHCFCCSSAGGVERFFRRMALAQDHQCLAAPFLEGHRGDRSALATFFIGPREARIRRHFDIRAEKRDRFWGVVEYQTVLASDTSIQLARQQGHSHR